MKHGKLRQSELSYNGIINCRSTVQKISQKKIICCMILYLKILTYCDIRVTCRREIVTYFAAPNQILNGHRFKDKSELKTTVTLRLITQDTDFRHHGI
jgi:hypothetical protein